MTDEHAPGLAPPPPPSPPTTPGPINPARRITSDECMMAMLCHLLAIFTGFIAPLIIWLMKKKESRFVDAHGRESLNWTLTVVGVYVVFTGCLIGAVFCIPVIGLGAGSSGGGDVAAGSGAAAGGAVAILATCLVYIVLIGLGIYNLVMQIMGAVAANKGRRFSYHFTIPFVGRPDWPAEQFPDA